MSRTYVNSIHHVIWGAKERRGVLRPEWKDELHAYIGGVLRNKGGNLICGGGMPDHVHLLISLPSSISVSEASNFIKSNSSRWIRRTRPRSNDFRWQGGYAAFSVSKSREKDVVRYIRDQPKHHRRLSFADELKAFLDRHGVEYDADLLWK